MVSRIWHNALAVAALLDFAAAWTHQIEVDRWEPYYATSKKRAAVPTPLPAFWATLAANHTLLGLVFSLLWFCDAFVTARDNWINTVRELDRRRLLAAASNKTGQEPPPPTVETTTWFGWDKPTVVYVQTIVFQVVLLPVGFYFLVYNVLAMLARGENPSATFQWNTRDDLEQQVQHYYSNHVSSSHKKGGSSDPVAELDDYFEDYTSYTLLFAILRMGMISVGRMIQKEGTRQAKDVAVQVARKALRNPISFSRRAKKILAYLRWLKYLMPIVATSNKFLQNLKDLLKKQQQKRQARIARKIRERLMRKRTPEEIREHAALCMQKVYRAKKARRLAKALKLFQGDKETIAVMKLQKQLRAALERARERIRQKRQELADLQQKQKELKAKSQSMGERDRARMYELHQELQKHTDYVINKMLLRPNTPFIVWWKAAFVFAVLFEIAGKALEPKMKNKYKSYNNMVERNMLPQRWATLPECNPKPAKVQFYDSLFQGVGRWMGNNATSTTTTAEAVTTELPWHCSPTHMLWQGAAVSVMELVIRKFDVFMAIIFFLDVFISFFTGEFHEETGVLNPPGFFPRYILPGVFLQCMVNPQMETTAKVIKWCIGEFLFLGPVRVTRWMVALVVPFLLFLRAKFQALRHAMAERQGALVKAPVAL